MAGLIRRDDIDEVRARVNIAEVVGDYVTLKGAGVGSLKGLCPFHDERSPSFHVRPQVGRYHCFGCGEDGDVFTFLQRMDHMSFTEAVELLAGRVGVQLRYEDGGEATRDHGNRARLVAANTAAAEFFSAQLLEPGAEPARRFLGERGFDPAAAARFGVGFAPKSFDALTKHLRGRGFTEVELVTAGLVSRNDRGNTYDRFRGRAVWPIRDVTGQTLGFGARKLLDDDQGPKYLNTPETPIYRKSQVLYGLDLAKRDISRGKQVVVVEGYTDVMACHLAGVTSAVATCGTAFGVDHIKVVRRVMGDFDTSDSSALGEVVFTFDPDEAGQKAASRAFAEEQRFAAQTFVAVAPDGLDPCDLRLRRGDEAVRTLVESKKPMFEFMIRRRLAEHDLDTVEGRVAALRVAAPIVAGIRDRALSIGYVRSVAGWLGVDPAEVSRAVAAASRRAPDGGGAPERDGQRRAEPAPESSAVAQMSLTDLSNAPATRLERDALMAILQAPDAVGLELVGRVCDTVFSDPSLATVRDAIVVALGEFVPVGAAQGELVQHAVAAPGSAGGRPLGGPAWVESVLSQVPEAFRRLATELAVAPLPEKADRDLTVFCRGVAVSVIERDLLRQKADLLGRLQRTDPQTEAERRAQIQRALVDVERERRALRDDE